MITSLNGVAAREEACPTDDPVARMSTLEIANAELVEANRRLQHNVQRLQRLVFLDPLTGLGNRRYFDAIVAAEIRRAARMRRPLTLLVCDVDHFKRCNDMYGHDVGDAVLVEVAGSFRRCCRRGGDVAARLGGDEFALVLPGLPSYAAEAFADDLRVAATGMEVPHCHAVVTLSIGGATFLGGEPCRPADLVRAADRALYQAKRAGRNRAVFVGRQRSWCGAANRDRAD